MTKNFCLAVNGLHEELFGGPLGQLANFLNRNTPPGTHFNVVGGVDPRPFINSFIHSCEVAAGQNQKLVLVGHSLGAMMTFYLADAMKSRNFEVALAVSIDSTSWGTNAGGFPPYSLSVGGQAGQYYIPDNVGHWMHFRQPVYPGGGRAQIAKSNTHTKFENFERAEPHVSLPVIPDIQQKILHAVLGVAK